MLCLIVALHLPRPARAHVLTTTISEIAVDAGRVDWILRVDTADLLEPLGLPEDLASADLLDARERILAYVAPFLDVTAGGRGCERTWQDMQIDPADVVRTPGSVDPSHDVRFDFRFRCNPDAAPVVLHYRLFFDLDPLHTGFARVAMGSDLVVTHLFRLESSTMALTAPSGSWWHQALQYLALGIEHIFIGYDHLAFLAALILGTVLSRRSTTGVIAEAASQRHALLRTVEIVTAFTIGHSITLILAAVQPDDLGGAWVEPAVALSVAYVGFENLRPRVARRRWLVAFGFGLIHGFGFASVLQEIGLPQWGFLSALLSFNVGVELGQIAIVAATLPILLALARRDPVRFELWGVRAASFFIGVAGVFWFVARVI